MAFDAFISYSSADKIAADAACAVLEASGVRCWIAPRDIRAGVEYGGAIIDAIDHCRVMVLVFSASANESRQIRREIERAVAKGIPILPLRIEAVTPTQSMEYFLGAIHWLDALTPPIEQHLERLAQTVKAMLNVDAGAQAQPARDDAQTAVSAPESAGGTARAIAKRPARPSWLLPAIAAAAMVLVIAGGAWLYHLGVVALPAAPGSIASQPSGPTTLRAAAQARNFLIGTAAKTEYLRWEPIYSEALAREYNVIIPEIETRFGRVHPTRTEFKFDDPDAMVEFAAAHGIKMYGQPLVWGGELPQWLTGGNFAPGELSAILKEFIQTTVRHYRGRIQFWDVIWTIFDNLGKMSNSFWFKALGPDYVQQAFEWAHEADPQAKLFFREHIGNEPLGVHADTTYDLLRKFRARGVPIDGIAIGSATLVDRSPKLQDMAANMSRLAALGLDIYVVDFEVSVPVPPASQDLQKQAAIYRDYLATCLSISGCKGLLTWGFTDKHSYAPDRWKGMGVGAALPFDASYKPKPAFAAMLDVLNGPRVANR